MRAMIAPGTEGESCICGDFFQPVVVFGANGFVVRFHDGWVSGAEAEDVCHDEAAESPVDRVADATADGGVVFYFICGGRVEAYEHAVRF